MTRTIPNKNTSVPPITCAMAPFGSSPRAAVNAALAMCTPPCQNMTSAPITVPITAMSRMKRRRESKAEHGWPMRMIEGSND